MSSYYSPAFCPHIRDLWRCLLKLLIHVFLSFITVLSWAPDSPGKASDIPEDLTDLSIEELMNIEVTSVSKKSQKLSDAATAVFVVTEEDIRRSGVTSIPEALRMVPGLQVARITSNKWAVSSRGFNGRFANKLLVLRDGRSLYTPIFSGVFWDMHDTIMEDIDRIEVIRGPGASLWGANAVNGVINIITKNATETHGGLITAGGGDEERRFGSFRYGAQAGETLHWRAYGKYFDRDGGAYASGSDAPGDWDMGRGGFRMDWEGLGGNSAMVQGELYDGQEGNTETSWLLTPPYAVTESKDFDINGGHLLGNWKRDFSDTANMQLQLYYDWADRESIILESYQENFDVDFHHQFALGKAHNIIWGLGYRFYNDDLDGTFTTSFQPKSTDTDLFSAFAQDEISIIPNRLSLTIGSKFEYNEYTDLEIQPSGRAMWHPHQDHSIWASVSRAVRTPSRAEIDTRLVNQVLPAGSLLPTFPGPGVVALIGNDDFESEELTAYEMGYRVQPNETVSIDAAAFFNDYDNLRSLESANSFVELSPPPAHLVIPVTAGNKLEGETYGVEFAVKWMPCDRFTVQGTYTYLKMHLDLDADSTDTSSESAEGDSPQNQLGVRTWLDLPWNMELDFWIRYVDNLPNQAVGSYVSLDARLGWKPLYNLELSIIGQNLGDSQHQEFTPDILTSPIVEVERSIFGKISWEF